MTLRRPVAGPLLLALIFLAVIGASVGVGVGWYVAGLGNGGGGEGGGNNAGGGGVQQPQTPGPDQSSSAGQSPEQPQARGCPDVTEAAAKRQLVLELYIRTENSQVWICRDTADQLWYQGNRHRGNPQDQLPAANSDDTLFIGTVATTDYGFVASNPGENGVTKYQVSRTQLVIDNPGGGPDFTETAIAEFTYPPAG